MQKKGLASYEAQKDYFLFDFAAFTTKDESAISAITFGITIFIDLSQNFISLLREVLTRCAYPTQYYCFFQYVEGEWFAY